MHSQTLPKTAIQLTIDQLEPQIHFHINARFKRDVEWIYTADTISQVIYSYSENAYMVLWYHIEKYYLHARAIIANSKGYNTGTVAKALDRMRDFQNWILYHPDNLEGLVNNTINAGQFFRDLLPVPTNNSYTSSLAKYEMIRNTAIEIKRQLQELKANHVSC